MKTNPCTCAKPHRSARYYMGLEACRLCGRLIQGNAPAPPPEPEPEVDRGELTVVAAQIFKAMPHLRNKDVYDRLHETYGDGLPDITTWLTNGWASEARKLSGTTPIAGRPAK